MVNREDSADIQNWLDVSKYPALHLLPQVIEDGITVAFTSPPKGEGFLSTLSFT